MSDVEPLLADDWPRARRTIDLVTAGTDDYRPELLELLTAQERARLDRLLRPPDRVRSSLGMVLLRLVASERDGIDPRQIEIDRTCPECGTPHGKPRVAGGHHYSVGHAGDLVVVAATASGAVGVDVEPADRRLVPTSIPDPDHRQLRSWVRREAVVKAIGDGRAVESDDPIVDDTAQGPLLIKASGIDPATITIIDLDLDPAYVAALAFASGEEPRVVHRAARPLLARWATPVASAGDHRSTHDGKTQ
ncbi:MAG: 4'-phosphopantetheinyl transferase superfamily protein [Acidimicrobiia bacterium]